MTPKEYLTQLSRLGCEIEARLEEARQLRALEGFVATKDAELRSCQDMLHREIGRLVALKREADGCIGQIKNPDYRVVLRLRYLCGYGWEEIARRMFFSKMHVQRLHRLALEQLHVPEKTAAAR